ncbi:C10 family peptidase [Pedobacter alluvionis]|uniref:Spi protease inhibitor n=1 Tax=Pedobacter alluvionis TaxID=475253 RepID=A0A497Y245_9SPHI|nr:C10 family peptidase [Pedobacter alluvionis]RLJ76842.1 Spi protease inhibitor [Pedobacter alluvionis]TFB33897.1 hypothetical protein E3V97_07570 [Pedobacter alluvionis]
MKKKSESFRITRKFKLFSYSLLVGSATFLFSCSKDGSELSNHDVPDTNFVSKTDAKDFAINRVVFNKSNSAKLMSKSTDRNSDSHQTLDIVEVGDQKPSYYIINYSNGGFVIISGDKRLDPVLAFSETSNFNLNSSATPSGLIAWLSNMDERIKNLRKGITTIDKKVAKMGQLMWKKNEVMGFNPDPDPSQFANCTQEGMYSSESTYKGPYLSTTWGQTGGYNDNSPNIGCGNGQLPPTGCVATSMAQIMRYYQKPSTYNWSSMANNFPTSETARLMRDAGNSVNMDYGCLGSSAVTSKTANAFINTFGYASAQFQDYNYNVVVAEINGQHPVILSGGKNDGWWIFGSYADGHAWVCDGLLEMKNYQCTKTYTPFSSTPILMKQERSTYLYLHMNWGWQGQYDGYYAFNNFNPDSYTFNYKRGMVTNIRP